MESIVSLDIETTGLDSDKDAIIEIGAVKFTGNRVEGELQQLIHPGRRIPQFISQLTGINDQMVLQAPSIQTFLPTLVQFIGRSPILGHNVKFDISFFSKYRVLNQSEAIDTYEMASVFLPSANRYNLGSLALALKVLLPATHRALDDARATRGVYLKLMEEAESVPTPLIAELLRLSEPIQWGAYYPLKEILKKRSREPFQAKSARSAMLGPIFQESAAKFSAPLLPTSEPQPLVVDEVSSLLEQGGAFSRHFPEFEFRIQQVEMLRAITQAFSESHHLMVEAGTGVGKSIAYLIPAALWALQNNCRVVVSTNTINLQEQLIRKDIPDLKDALGFDLRAVVLKGRSNYICPRRLENMRRRGPESADEMRILGKVMVWLQSTSTGDRSEINLNGTTERNVWARLSAEDEGCTTENCLKRTGGNCPFFRVRQAAQSAHLLVVNHALLLADVATGNRVLPEYQYLIVDEAHHLEAATTDALSFEISQSQIEWILRELGSPSSGLLGWLLNATSGLLAPAEYAVLNQLVQRLTDIAFRFANSLIDFFRSIDQFMEERREGKPIGQYSHQERILSSTRTLPEWGEVELTWDDSSHPLKQMNEFLAKIVQGVGEISDALNEEDNELFGSLSNIYRQVISLSENMEGLVFKPSQDQVYWIEARANGPKISLHAAPVHIGSLMEKFLWNEKQSVILTSATLTTAGEFDYLRGRLNAQDADELALGSPFDFENAALLYLINDIPEPNDRGGHQHAVEQGLIQLCHATGGRTLALFTSYDQLRRTSQAISPVLAKHGIITYEQGDGASPNSLLDSFRTTEKAILLGTRSFWEGVDIAGDALSVLAIIKLPFDVPSDPLIAARSESFEDPFDQYSVPEAILKFRQGFGRLIRTQHDRGAVVIFDRRVLNKRYGKQFIDSLPNCTIKVGSLANLPQTVAKWLN